MIKKRIFLINILILIILTALTGCGGNDVALDPDKLAEALVTQNAYEDQLSPLNENAFYALYGIDPAGDDSIESYVVYTSTGATAEEVAVLTAADASKVKSLEEAVQARIEAQKAGFENYVPKELEKLKNPVVETKGRYVILCVSNDNDKANEIIGEFVK